MGINLTSNFTEQAALPLDDRFIFATTIARDALAAGRRYKGMICWVLADEVHYKLKNDLVTWEALSGSGASIPDFIGDAGAGGTAGLVPAPAIGDGAANKYLKASGGWGVINHTTLSNIGIKTHSVIDALLENFIGDAGAGGSTGLVPAPGAGTAAAGKFLKADGTWQVPPMFSAALGGEVLRTQYLRYTGGGLTATSPAYGAISRITNNTNNVGENILSFTGSSSVGFALTALVRTQVTVSYSASDASGTSFGFSLNTSQPSISIAAASGMVSYTTIPGGEAGTITISLIMEVGDVLRTHVNYASAPDYEIVEITAIDIETPIGTLYTPFVGDTGTGGVEGLVPAPAPGDANKVLLGNGTWAAAPNELPIRYGTGAPSLLVEIPSAPVELYYDTSVAPSGFVTLWIYSDILANWYPIKTDYFAKHVTEAIVFIENIAIARIRDIIETLAMVEILHKTRLRPISEGIIITENLIVLVLTSSSPEINGSAINGAPL